ncbi:MAG: alpha/beta fold hydrolase [Proteobacteria bacterium]|nr:alpha/beta fold hydrolase [Pseudomonadota bacterium]
MHRLITVMAMLIVMAGTIAHAAPAPVWETGQKTSYYDGDDGDLERGVAWPSPRFADQGNGTVTDNLTGLMWTKNANLPNGYRTWQQALDYVSGMNAGTYPNYGYHDWRLPNRKELFSLIDHSRYNPALPADHPFANVQAVHYWSSTTYALYPGYAWLVYMWSGVVHYVGKSFNVSYVWPVRAGQSGSFGNLVISFRDKENSSSTIVGAAADGASQAVIQIDGLPPGTTLGNITISVSEGDGTLDNDGQININNGVYTRTYHAPEHYAREGHTEDEIQGRRAVGLTITVNGENVPYPQFYLVKPPVVLLHGLWSDGETWDKLKTQLEANGYDSQHIIAQSYPSSVSFEENSTVVNERVQEALKAVTDEGYVAKKADVVAHSMGGVLTKLYGHASDIHSIITVGTPHYGSPLADFLWPIVNTTSSVGQFIAKIFGRRGWTLDGAIEDLQIEKLQDQVYSLHVPTHTIAGISPHTDTNTFVGLLSLAVAAYGGPIFGSPTALNEYFFDFERNDWVVGETSQEGGWPGDDESVLMHFSFLAVDGETRDDEVIDSIIAFLHRTSTPPSPAPALYAQTLEEPRWSRFLPDMKMAESSGTVEITNPLDGQTFQPGDTVTVEISVSNENAIVLLSTSTGESALIEQAPYTFQFVIPSDAIGPLTITVGARDDVGFIASDEVTINIAQTSDLIAMALYPDSPLIPMALGSSVPLTVYGLYGDTVTRNITASGCGTTYSSSNSTIAEVLLDGMITANSAGQAIITVTNSGVSKQVTAICNSEPDITVMPVGYHFGSVNVGTSSAVQNFTVANTGNADLIIGTLSLTGSEAGDFTIQQETCSGRTLGISSEECTVDVLFTPTASGLRNANLTITSNDPDRPTADVPISGEGITPTVIQLSSFTATSSDRKVILEWTTASEIDNAGFNLYRAESENGQYAKINPSLIPAQGSSTKGASYQFIDENVQNRKTYYYKLEDIDLNGKSTMHGPVSATPRRIQK